MKYYEAVTSKTDAAVLENVSFKLFSVFFLGLLVQCMKAFRDEKFRQLNKTSLLSLLFEPPSVIYFIFVDNLIPSPDSFTNTFSFHS